MTVLEYALGMILVGGVLFLLVSFVFGRGEALAPMPPDAVPVELPEDRPAGAEDIHRLRLPVVLRGYRMHEVDWVLERLATELELRDAEIARLRAEMAGEPSRGGPLPGEAADGDPQRREPQQGDLQQGDLQRGEPQRGGLQRGGLQRGDPRSGEPFPAAPPRDGLRGGSATAGRAPSEPAEEPW